jgi:Ca2+-binding EF-hand superfamily protein
MNAERPPKKSAMLEVRLPHETKLAFMRRCRALGLSASEVVRGQIERFLAATAPEQERRMKLPIPDHVLTLASRPQAAMLAAALALGVGFIATPSIATPDLREAFNRFDADHDGEMTLDEFRAGMSGDQVVSFQRSGTISGLSREEAERLQRAAAEGSFVIPLPPAAQGSPALAGEPVPAARLREMNGREFGRMDLDGDANVTFPEFENAHHALLRASFIRFDQNLDQYISADEFGLGAPLPIPRSAIGAKTDAQGQSLVAMLDRDGDGRISWTEFSDPKQQP